MDTDCLRSNNVPRDDYVANLRLTIHSFVIPLFETKLCLLLEYLPFVHAVIYCHYYPLLMFLLYAALQAMVIILHHQYLLWQQRICFHLLLPLHLFLINTAKTNISLIDHNMSTNYRLRNKLIIFSFIYSRVKSIFKCQAYKPTQYIFTTFDMAICSYVRIEILLLIKQIVTQ